MELIDRQSLIDRRCSDCSPQLRSDCKKVPVCHEVAWLQSAPVVDAIEKIADELVDGLCPLDSYCPKRLEGGMCYEHWVNYLRRVVEE